MAFEKELQSLTREREGLSHGSPPPVPKVEPENEDHYLPFGSVFAGAPGAPLDGAANRLGAPAFSHSVNHSVRALALQRAQQSYGNHAAQRLVARLQRKPSSSRVLQRSCACGGICATCSATTMQILSSIPLGLPQTYGVIQAQAAGAFDPVGIERADSAFLPPRRQGQALDKQTRRFMESRFGRDFGEVRVHADEAADASARAMNADAYTTGRDIYFAAGKYAPSTQEGQHLLAHELTHTLQQSQGAAPTQVAAQTRAGLIIGSADDPLEHEAEQTARRVVGPAAAASPSAAITPSWRQAHSQPAAGSPAHHAVAQRQGGEAGGQGERGFLERAGDTLSEVGSAVVNAPGQIAEASWETIKEQFWRIVRAIAPQAEPYLRNPALLWRRITDAISSGIDSLVGGVLSLFREGGFLANLQSFFHGFVAKLRPILAGLANKDCGPLFAALQAAADAFSQFAEPVIAPVRDFFQRASAKVSQAFSAVSKPLMELFRSVGGTVWNWVRGLINDISRVASRAKELAGRAWSWLKGILGLNSDDHSPNGLWEWVKEKAQAAWAAISPTLMRWIGPLRVLGGILLAVSPVGPLFLAITYGPRVVLMLRDLWRYLSNPQRLVEAREYLSNTLLPGAIALMQQVAGVLTGVAQKVTAALRKISEPLAELVEALNLAGIFQSIVNLFISFVQLIQRAITWASTALPEAFHTITEGLAKLWTWLRPIVSFLATVALIYTNPLALALVAASYIWRMIPDCIKDPIIRFILDVLIRFVEAMPDLSTLGILWVFVKHGTLGFLRRLRGQGETSEALRVMNRIAKLFTAPADFALGLAVGILAGIWDGIIGPIQMLVLVVEGITKLSEFLESVREQFDEKVQGVIASVSHAVGFISNNVGNLLGAAFGGGSGGNPLATLVGLLGRAWDALKGGAQRVGSAIAGALIGLIMSADYELGHGVGYVAGLVIFEVALAILTAGVSAGLKFFSTAIGRVLKLLVKVNQAMGKIFEGILHIIPGLERALGRLFETLAELPIIKQLVEHFQQLFNSLKELGMNAMRRFGGEVATEAAGAGARAIGGHGGDLARAAGQADEASARALSHEAEPAAAGRPRTEAPEAPTARDAHVDETSHLESAQLTQRQLDEELQHIADNPHLIEGTPPNRRAKIGDHVWEENPRGGWCRHSDGEGCVITPPEPLKTGPERLTPEEQKAISGIADYRAQYGLPEFKPRPGSTGTVAFTEVEGQRVFSHNTKLEREAFQVETRAMREEALQEIQSKLNKLQGVKYGAQDAMFLTHGEAGALISAQKQFGKLPENLTIYVDRVTCPACQGQGVADKGLGLLAELYGVKELTIIDSFGNKLRIRPGLPAEKL